MAFASGCGQNAHVTDPGQAGQASQEPQVAASNDPIKFTDGAPTDADCARNDVVVVNKKTQELFRVIGGKCVWQFTMIGERGPRGPRGRFFPAAGPLLASDCIEAGKVVACEEGDTGLDRSSGNLYWFDGGKWVFQLNVKGPKGDNARPIIVVASGDPTDAQCIDGKCAKGDLAVRGDSSEMIQLGTDGKWNVVSKLRGADGKNARRMIFVDNGDPADADCASANNGGKCEEGDIGYRRGSFEIIVFGGGKWTGQGSLKGLNGTNARPIKTVASGDPVDADCEQGKCEDGDLVIRADSSELIRLVGGKWQIESKLRGAKGDDARPIVATLKGLPLDTDCVGGKCKQGDLAIRGDTSELIKLGADGNWAFQSLLRGKNGRDARRTVFIASGDPTDQDCGLANGQDSSTGKCENGDMGFRRDSGELILHVDGKWNVQGSLKGADGKVRRIVSVESGDPVDANCVDGKCEEGDLAVRKDSAELIRLVGGQWNIETKLRGANGKDARRLIFVASGDPRNEDCVKGLCEEGDIGFRRDLSEIIVFEGGKWDVQGVLKGENGAPARRLITVASADPVDANCVNAKCEENDYALRSDSSEIIRLEGGKWIVDAKLKGANGKNARSIILVESGDPADGNCVEGKCEDGDLAIRLTTNELLIRIGGEWKVKSTLQGARGNNWLISANAPSDQTCKENSCRDGDFVIDRSTDQVWKLVASVWVDQTYNIRGLKGDPGPTGSPGPVVTSTITIREDHYYTPVPAPIPTVTVTVTPAPDPTPTTGIDDKGKLRGFDDVRFEGGKDVVYSRTFGAANRPIIADLVKWILENRGKLGQDGKPLFDTIEVAGHTNTEHPKGELKGSVAYEKRASDNQDLSDRRAQHVADELILGLTPKLGKAVAEAMISKVGWGEDPDHFDYDPKDKANIGMEKDKPVKRYDGTNIRNRRVEFNLKFTN